MVHPRGRDARLVRIAEDPHNGAPEDVCLELVMSEMTRVVVSTPVEEEAEAVGPARERDWHCEHCHRSLSSFGFKASKQTRWTSLASEILAPSSIHINK